VAGAQVQVPDGAKPEDLIKSRKRAVLALWRYRICRAEDDTIGCYLGYDQLIHYIEYGRQEEKAKSGGKGLVENPAEFVGCKEAYRRKTFTPRRSKKGSTVGGFIGIDGGSTSRKRFS